MERLTEKCWRNLDPWETCGQDKFCTRGCHDKGGCTNGCKVPKQYKKLAEYEDAEEQGLLPKFHMADEFWVIGHSNRVLKAKIVMLQQKKDKSWKYRFCDEYSNTYDYAENEVGVRFFLTNLEAEQILADMKKG